MSFRLKSANRRSNIRRHTGVGSARSEARLRAILEGEITFRRNRVLQPSGREPPRLTWVLRAFGGVSSELSCEPVVIDEAIIREKRKRRRANEKSWATVSEETLSLCSRHSEANVSGVHLECDPLCYKLCSFV